MLGLESRAYVGRECHGIMERVNKCFQKLGALSWRPRRSFAVRFITRVHIRAPHFCICTSEDTYVFGRVAVSRLGQPRNVQDIGLGVP